MSRRTARFPGLVINFSSHNDDKAPGVKEIPIPSRHSYRSRCGTASYLCRECRSLPVAFPDAKPLRTFAGNAL